MKSAYELAMERLNKTSPTTKLTAEQKAEIADLDSLYASKIAEREISLKGDIEKAQAKGDYEKAVELEKELVFARKKLQGDLEDKKEAVRQRKK
jgi:hypothetical protein